MRLAPCSHCEGVIEHLVIVAGGKGTRLSREAGDLPKALVTVGGKPVLQHQLEWAAGSGMRHVTIFAGHGAKAIRDFADSGLRFGLSVRVLVESSPLGTAGGVLQSLELLPDEFAVVYGDVMLAVDAQRMSAEHRARAADFTALVHPNDHPHDSDLVEADADGWVTAVHEAPHPDGACFANLVNAAFYMVRRDALRPMANGGPGDFVKDVMSGLVASGARVLAYRSAEYIKDMGTPLRLGQVEADWQAGRIGRTARRPAVFLDRDGTLNAERGHLRDARDFELLPGIPQALQSLRAAGFRLVVLTNQPVIARGEASAADVAAVHRRLEWELGKGGAFVDAIYVCPHHPDSGFPGERDDLKVACDCRKPEVGLFERACRELEIDPAGSWMIGDQTRDIEMARRAGLRSILVQTGVAGQDGCFDAVPDLIAADLPAAVALMQPRTLQAQ